MGVGKLRIFTIQSTNQPTIGNQPIRKWNSIQPDVHHFTVLYSNCFVGFFTYLLGWAMLTHLTPCRIAFNGAGMLDINFNVFDGQKAYHQLIFFFKLELFHHRSSAEWWWERNKHHHFHSTICLESEFVENSKIEQNHAKIENYEQKLKWIWMALWKA